MALTFPRDLPAVRFMPGRFVPEYRHASATTHGGTPQAAELAPTLWSMHYETAPLSEADAEIMRAWLSSLRGGIKKFKAYDPMRRFPLLNQAGFGALTRHAGGAFDGTVTINSAGGTLDTITISTLPSTFAISIGDMISVNYASGRRTLHRAVEATTASAGVATITIEPVLFPSPQVGVAGAATLASPYCFAVVVPNSVDERRSVARTSVFTFDARQTFAP